jgi:hypothetical protein
MFFFPFTVIFNTEIENPCTCEVRSVTSFRRVRLAEIHGQIVGVCGEDAVNEGNARFLKKAVLTCGLFKGELRFWFIIFSEAMSSLLSSSV